MAAGPAPVPGAILANTADPRVRLAMLMGSFMEGGWGPTYGVGDNGTSFGPFQIHNPASQGTSVAAALNPSSAVAFMLGRYQAGSAAQPAQLWQTNPELAAEQAAVSAENPAQSYYGSQGRGSVDAAYRAALSVMGGSTPAGNSSAVTTASVSSTPSGSVGGGLGVVGSLVAILAGVVLLAVGFRLAFGTPALPAATAAEVAA